MSRGDGRERKSKIGFQQFLLIAGVPAVLFAAALAGRILWEETYLTSRQGPQMIGFSLAHGSFAILLLAPFFLMLWLVMATPALVVFWRKRSLSGWFSLLFVASAVTLGLVALPPAFWQWAFIGKFAQSPHAVDLMTYAAAEGDAHTVARYLSHGVPLEGRNYEGLTAAFTAAASGNTLVIELLARKGANLSAVNLYGDSPLEAATKNNHTEVVAFLKAHGAIEVEGSPEQREAASEQVVRRQIQQNH